MEKTNKIAQAKQMIKTFSVDQLIGKIITIPTHRQNYHYLDLHPYIVTHILPPEKGEKRFEIWCEEIETKKISFFKANKLVIMKYYKKFSK